MPPNQHDEFGIRFAAACQILGSGGNIRNVQVCLFRYGFAADALSHRYACEVGGAAVKRLENERVTGFV